MDRSVTKTYAETRGDVTDILKAIQKFVDELKDFNYECVNKHLAKFVGELAVVSTVLSKYAFEEIKDVDDCTDEFKLSNSISKLIRRADQL